MHKASQRQRERGKIFGDKKLKTEGNTDKATATSRHGRRRVQRAADDATAINHH
jgi:uncharacterized protein YjbJ (UPF0337 family)